MSETWPRLPKVAHNVLIHVAHIVGLPVGIEEAHLEQHPLAPRRHLQKFLFVSHIRVVLPILVAKISKMCFNVLEISNHKNL